MRFGLHELKAQAQYVKKNGNSWVSAMRRQRRPFSFKRSISLMSAK